jgi:hypothetical protein
MNLKLSKFSLLITAVILFEGAGAFVAPSSALVSLHTNTAPFSTRFVDYFLLIPVVNPSRRLLPTTHAIVKDSLDLEENYDAEDKSVNLQFPVSANNPCPFLRALVSQGELNDSYEKPSHIADVIADVAERGYGSPSLSKAAMITIAAGANGAKPWQVANAFLHGTHLAELRNGPLDKKGAGTRILNADGVFVKSELDRMASFGSAKIDTATGVAETGLNEAEITTYNDSNFARAVGHRRKIDRLLMNAELPVLNNVMGKQGEDGERYISMAEVETLFEKRTLPSRFLIK